MNMAVSLSFRILNSKLGDILGTKEYFDREAYPVNEIHTLKTDLWRRQMLDDMLELKDSLGDVDITTETYTARLDEFRDMVARYRALTSVSIISFLENA